MLSLIGFHFLFESRHFLLQLFLLRNRQPVSFVKQSRLLLHFLCASNLLCPLDSVSICRKSIQNTINFCERFEFGELEFEFLLLFLENHDVFVLQLNLVQVIFIETTYLLGAKLLSLYLFFLFVDSRTLIC